MRGKGAMKFWREYHAPKWKPHGASDIRAHWLESSDGRALVRTKPMPDGRFMWHAANVVGYAESVDAAKRAALDYLESGVVS